MDQDSWVPQALNCVQGLRLIDLVQSLLRVEFLRFSVGQTRPQHTSTVESRAIGQTTPSVFWHAPELYSHDFGPYLEGQGDIVSGLILGISRVIIWVIGVINLLSKSP